MLGKRKMAIVYDWIDKWGGVERILLTLHEVFPKADFYTSYYNSEKAPWARSLNIKTSFIQRLPNFIKNNRVLSFFLYPYAFEAFDFTDYDLIISVTSSFAKAIITKPKTVHINYLLTPTRYIWVSPKLYLNDLLFKIISAIFLDRLKKWDFIAAQRPDKIISISETVAKRCKKYYHRQSEIIYPGFDRKYWTEIRLKTKNITRFNSIINKKYFLLIGRLEPYKKTDLVIELFNQLDKQLIIVGEGSQEKRLKKLAATNIHFFDKLTDPELGFLYKNAQALIMPQEEDFGYISLEAQFFDCPVIAYKKGGATETIIDGKTGIFFDRQTKESLSDAIERFHMISYNLKMNIQKNAAANIEKFEKDKFIRNILNAITL